MRKVLLAILIISLLIVPAASAQGDPAVMGAEWLSQQQNEDGSFGGEVIPTAFAAMALAAVGENNADALAWLENYFNTAENPSIDEISITLLAVIANQGDVNTFAGGSPFAAFTTQSRRLRGENVDQLCGAMTVLPNAGQTIPPIAVQGIVALQNEDGGFGVAPGEPSNVGSTAICAQVLAAVEETESLTKALEYLKSIQNEDGGWSTLEEGATDAFATGYVIMALKAAGEDYAVWGNPENVMFSLMNPETGEFNTSFAEEQLTELNVLSTALAILNFRGKNFVNLAETEETAAPVTTDEPDSTASAGDAPALDADWPPIGAQFQMAELDTADDFLVTVIDPFTQEELTGIEIINWLAEYQYTGYMIEEHLPAEVLLFLGEQDPATWENISDATLALLPAEVIAELPEEVQARVE